jgi:hypothetical protein
MKIKDILRTQALVIGFAATLSLASAAPAQEITNTEWPDAPGSTTTVRTAPQASAVNSSAVNSNVPAVATQAAIQPNAAQQASVAQWPALQSWMLACLLVFFTLVALYKSAAIRRNDQNRTSHRDSREVVLS